MIEMKAVTLRDRSASCWRRVVRSGHGHKNGLCILRCRRRSSASNGVSERISTDVGDEGIGICMYSRLLSLISGEVKRI